MAINPLNDISSIYVKEVFEPQLGKKRSSPAPAGGAKKVEKGKDDAESSAKRIRQAVYDIRYRARREDVKLDQAFNQYMSHTTMTGPEKTAVKEKLGLVSGPVSEEMEQKKYKVRVTDKSSGKSYVRYATREKINSLRANPNIRSVEMTSYGSPYEGERTKGDRTAAAKAGKDYDGDGKVESGAKEYRGAVHNAIQRKKGLPADGKDTSSVKESFSNWREDLCEVIDKIESNPKMITGKGGKKAKIVINPTLPEAIQNLGGELIEMVEIDERHMTAAEKAKEEKLGKKTKKSALPAMKQEYGEKKGTQVYYAWKRKQAMKEAAVTQTQPTQTTQQTKPQQTQQTQQTNLTDPRNKQLVQIQKKQLTDKMAQLNKGVPLTQSFELEGEEIAERTAFAKRTGMSATRKGRPSVEGGAKDDPAFTSVKRKIRGMEGTPKGQQKQVPGKKPPAAGQPGSGVKSPAQKVAVRRAAAQRSQDMYKPRAGESD